jgi:dienelactone hydrolase
MRESSKYSVAIILLSVLCLSGVYTASVFNSDFGKLKVGTITIKDGENQLSALLYRPESVVPEKPSAAIVLAHGISESKDIMSNIGLELAKRGFVVLCLDLFGHGGSDGTVAEGNQEPDFGVSAAVQYLEGQTDVNASKIGLIGHSLGGGAVRAEATQNKNIKATILIAGGIGPSTQGQLENLNSTVPKNLLVIVGKYDVLFNITKLETIELPLAFNTSTTILPDRLYGTFESGTARKLLVPATTHLFETIDPQVASNTIEWMESALEQNQNVQNETSIRLSYPVRELALIFSLVGLLGIILLVHSLATIFSGKGQHQFTTEIRARARWKTYAVWAALNLILFFPMVLVGFAISFPPLIFGSSVAWWVLGTGLIGILLFVKNKPRISETNPHLRTLLRQHFKREVLMAIVLFGLIFIISILLQSVFAINLRILAPIFQEVTQIRRIIAFAAFIPFFLVYFTVEGLYLHEPNYFGITKKGNFDKLRAWTGIVLAKISPFLIIIGVQYLPQLVLGVWVVPGFAGLLVEFLWLIIPIFVLTTTCSWWFHNKTRTIGTGVIFNALILAWMASVVFPF